ncbi:MAG: C40 family peptidase [Clostridia bacterium]
MNKKLLIILIIFALAVYLLYGCAAFGEHSELDLGEPLTVGDTDGGYGDSIANDNEQGENHSGNEQGESHSGSNGGTGDNTTPNENGTENNNSNPAPKEQNTNVAIYIKASVSVNIRSGAGTGYAVVGKMDRSDMLAYKGKSGAWYKTVYKEKTAYVSTLYTQLFEIDEGTSAVEAVIAFGQTLLGYPYVWGAERYHWGNSNLNANFANGKFDCSSFTQYIYYIKAGVVLNLTTRTQVSQGVAVEKQQIKRGDLLFFTNSSRRNLTGTERVGHVAVYLGRNYILHTASDHAVIEEISPNRWKDYITARRVL